jgi:hypothetical protein
MGSRAEAVRHSTTARVHTISVSPPTYATPSRVRSRPSAVNTAAVNTGNTALATAMTASANGARRGPAIKQATSKRR